MSITDTLQVRVRSITWEADGILSFELCPMPPRKDLPAFTAGAHVDVHLPNGVLRSYSLLNSQDERHRYVIGVNKDAQSRGGSRYMHETLRAGDTLTIGLPRNNFPLDEAAPLSVFIAGGIGITPFMSMLRRSAREGMQHSIALLYSNRRARDAAYLEELRQLAQTQPKFRLVTTMTEEGDGFVQQFHVAGNSDVVSGGISEPCLVIGDARAHSLARVR